MAKNHVQGKGTIIAVAAPSGGSSSGDIVAIRNLIGVAQHESESGARLEVECAAGPVFELNADTNLQIDVGDRVFYDVTNDWVDKTTGAGIQAVGIAIPLETLSDIAKATAGTTVRVLMGPTALAGT